MRSGDCDHTLGKLKLLWPELTHELNLTQLVYCAMRIQCVTRVASPSASKHGRPKWHLRSCRAWVQTCARSRLVPTLNGPSLHFENQRIEGYTSKSFLLLARIEQFPRTARNDWGTAVEHGKGMQITGTWCSPTIFASCVLFPGDLRLMPLVRTCALIVLDTSVQSYRVRLLLSHLWDLPKPQQILQTKSCEGLKAASIASVIVAIGPRAVLVTNSQLLTLLQELAVSFLQAPWLVHLCSPLQPKSLSILSQRKCG